MNKVRKHERKLNRKVRNINKSIWNDELFPKRFILSQVLKGSSDLVDREWYNQVYIYRIADLKSNDIREFLVDHFNYKRELFWKVNDFIIHIREKEGW